MTHTKLFITFILTVLVLITATVVYRTSSSRAPLPDDSFSTAEFGGVSLKIELATTSEARELGLGGRSEIPDDYGMLFVFTKPSYYGFWMKDTLVPLDIYWLNSQGQVVSIAQDVATTSFPNVFYPSEPALYVLETASGFARMHSIATGTQLRLKNR